MNKRDLMEKRNKIWDNPSFLDHDPAKIHLMKPRCRVGNHDKDEEIRSFDTQ